MIQKTFAAKLFKYLFVLFISLQSISSIGQVSLPTGMPLAADLILWLSPDSAVYRNSSNLAAVSNRVREWHDISGNGFNFVYTVNNYRPRLVEIDGFRYLDFANGDFLQNLDIQDSINGLTEFSIFMVVKSDVTNTDNGFLDSENPNGTDDKICLRYDASGANTGRTNLLKSGLGGNLASQQVETQSNTQTTDRQVLSITWSQGDRLRVYIDGVINDSSNSIINSPLSGIQKMIIGKGPKNTAGSSGWDGKIGSVIFYKKEFSPDTINTISQTIQTVHSVQSGDWNNINTWQCGCIPDSTQDVEIRTGHTVTLNANGTGKGIYIENGATLSFQSGVKRELVVKGSWNNQGTFNTGVSTVHMRGEDKQFLDGPNTIYHLIANNPAGLELLDDTIKISSELTLTNGQVTTADKLMITSGPSLTGRIGAITGGSLSGDVIMQRYIDAGSTNWRFVSSPIADGTIESWDDDFITSGFTGSDYPAFPFVSIYKYDETVLGTNNNGYVGVMNSSEAIDIGRGYSIWCGDTITGTQPFIIDYKGTVNTGTINFPVTYTDDPAQPASEDGWNLVGNPYPSSIDWESPSWTKAGINNAIYIWDPDAQQFASYVGGVGINGGSRYVASSQAFWVQANSTPTLTGTEAVKSSMDQAFLNTAGPGNFVKASINGPGGKDETVIRFDQTASHKFDPSSDARKVFSSNQYVPSILSILDTIEYSINSMNFTAADEEVQLEVKVKGPGSYTIQLTPEIDESLIGCIFFTDNETNTSFQLNKDTSYTCQLNPSTPLDRFTLRFGQLPESESFDATCYGHEDGKIVVAGQGEGPWNYIWRNSNEEIIHKTLAIKTADSLSNLPAGKYSVQITNSGICGEMRVVEEIEQPIKVKSAFKVSENEVDVKDKVQILFTNISVNANSHSWDFGDGNTSNLKNPQHMYTTPGEFQVRLVVSNSGSCADTMTMNILVTDEVTSIDEPVVTEIKATTYPNPTNGMFTLQFGTYLENLDITVYSTTGAKVLEVNAYSGTYIELNLEDFPKGIYLINLESDTVDEQLKIVRF